MSNSFKRSALVALLVGAMAAQCYTPPPVEEPATRDDIEKLEREARALAIVSGCTTAEQCRTAPVGERACGGPREYVVYCARSTDSVALHRKLNELREAEIAWNRRTGAVSTCEFRMPPDVGVVGGSCRAQ